MMFSASDLHHIALYIAPAIIHQNRNFMLDGLTGVSMPLYYIYVPCSFGHTTRVSNKMMTCLSKHHLQQANRIKITLMKAYTRTPLFGFAPLKANKQL